MKQVKIEIKDVNDNRPLFKTPYFEKSILENLPDGKEIHKFTAIDKDKVTKISTTKFSKKYINDFLLKYFRETMQGFFTL